MTQFKWESCPLKANKKVKNNGQVANSAPSSYYPVAKNPATAAFNMTAGRSGAVAGLPPTAPPKRKYFKIVAGNLTGKNGLKGDLLARLCTWREMGPVGSSRWPLRPSTELSELSWLLMVAANHWPGKTLNCLLWVFDCWCCKIFGYWAF